MFPLDKIINGNEFKGMDIVVCGHSLGGAIATAVAIELFIVLKHSFQKRTVKCITFGAPLTGDRDLQEFVSEQMSPHIHHFICLNDPVPQLLRYIQSISPKLEHINTRLSAVRHTMQILKDTFSAANTLNKLLVMKDSYSKIIETINQMMPTIRATVSTTSLTCHNVLAVANFQKIFNLVKDTIIAIKDDRDVYIPNGNFHFIVENFNDNIFFSCNKITELEKYIQVKYQHNSNNITPYSHTLAYYTDIFLGKGKLPFTGSFGRIQTPNNQQSIVNIREILFKYPYKPVIHSVELVKGKGQTISLKLSLTGENLDNVVLDLCHFDFNFLFAKSKENLSIKNMSIGDNVERLVIEQEMEDISISVAVHRTRLLLVTQFGECEAFILPENIRSIDVERVSQISENDSVSLVLRRAIQRGLIFKRFNIESGCKCSEQIIDEIIHLGTAATGEDEMNEKVTDILTDYNNNFNFLFSNEESFQKLKDFRNKIEDFIRSPLNIENEHAVIGVTEYTGTPSLTLIEKSEMSYTGPAFVKGTVSGSTSGAAQTDLINAQITNSNYKFILNFLLQELLKIPQKFLVPAERAEITDLLDQKSIFSKEKALTKLASYWKYEPFGSCNISKSTMKSKENIKKRIKMIQSIHRLREVFSQQCFIGVVGLQDAEKTTLIKKIWNVGGKPGYLSHTVFPKLYQITKKLVVVDFPGSNSLNYYSKKFSEFSAINNIVFVLIPFSGDVSKIYSQEIAKIFGVMKSSDSTKVVLCINKCGLYLNKLSEELSWQKNHPEFLKKAFIYKLNGYYKGNGESINVAEEDIFFSDWELEGNKESKELGIINVEEIKKIILKYLVDYSIYKTTEIVELQRCVSFASN